MPGIAVIVSSPNQPGLAEALALLLAPMTSKGHRSVQVVFPEIGVALGQTGPARPGRSTQFTEALPQPGYARGDAIAAVIEGEVLNTASLARAMALPESTTPAALLAALYAAEGSSAVDRLRGHCAVAIVDRRNHTVVVANDALGLRPIYRTRARDGAWLFASSPAALLAHPAIQREVDPAGLADYLAFGYGMGAKTLFQGVECMPPAAQITCQGGESTVRRYWQLQSSDDPTGHSEDRSPKNLVSRADLEALRIMFNDAVVETVRDVDGLSLALSGGMDSRAIFSALIAAGVNVQTLTHSVPNATDAHISAALARLAGKTHHFYEVRGEDLVDAILPGIRLIGGQLASVDVHPLCFLDDIATYTRVSLTGMGGALYKAAGPSGDSVTASVQTLDELVDGLFHQLNYKLKPETDFPALLTKDWLAALQHQPHQSIRASIAEISQHASFSSISGIVFLQEYMRKYLTKGDLLVRRDIETRHPMVTRDLLAQVHRLPYEARRGGKLMRYIVTRNVPAMADLPYEQDGRPMRYPLTPWDQGRQKLADLGRSLRRRLGLPRYRSVPSYRYTEWIRGPLRATFTDVLLDPRTLGRPYWQPDTIRGWVEEHMAGRNHTVRLGSLAAIELMMREFVDVAPGTPGAVA